MVLGQTFPLTVRRSQTSQEAGSEPLSCSCAVHPIPRGAPEFPTSLNDGHGSEEWWSVACCFLQADSAQQWSYNGMFPRTCFSSPLINIFYVTEDSWDFWLLKVVVKQLIPNFSLHDYLFSSYSLEQSIRAQEGIISPVLQACSRLTQRDGETAPVAKTGGEGFQQAQWLSEAFE